MLWNIWDFPDKIYVLLDDETRKTFFAHMHESFGSARKYAKFLGVSQKAERTYLKGKAFVRGKYYKQYIPLWVLKKSGRFIDRKLKTEIENNIVAMRSRAGLSVHNPRLPFKESPELYSVLFHMICDGSASEGKTPYYANTSTVLLNEFVRKLQVFGDIKAKTYLMHTNVYSVMFPKVITDILSHIFDINFTRTPNLPRRTFKAPVDCQRSALRAAFDDEGTVVYQSKAVSIVSAQEGIIRDIRDLLSQNGIRCQNIYTSKRNDGKTDYRVAISADSRSCFLDLVGFDSPEKMFRLKKIVGSTKTKCEMRLEREMLKSGIYKVLTEGVLTRGELAKKFESTKPQVTNILYELRDENKVISRCVRQDRPYLWYAKV